MANEDSSVAALTSDGSEAAHGTPMTVGVSHERSEFRIILTIVAFVNRDFSDYSSQISTSEFYYDLQLATIEKAAFTKRLKSPPGLSVKFSSLPSFIATLL
jgi:hypothetical protein